MKAFVLIVLYILIKSDNVQLYSTSFSSINPTSFPFFSPTPATVFSTHNINNLIFSTSIASAKPSNLINQKIGLSSLEIIAIVVGIFGFIILIIIIASLCFVYLRKKNNNTNEHEMQKKGSEKVEPYAEDRNNYAMDDIENSGGFADDDDESSNANRSKYILP